jgi:CHAT domain-containing protein/tetratricopeptide (TPR) repeat protein
VQDNCTSILKTVELYLTFPSRQPGYDVTDIDREAQLIERLTSASGIERDAAERAYMQLLEQRCESLIQHEPTALADAAASARRDLLCDRRNHQLIRYYQGLGAGLQDRFGPAQAAFDQLLAEPDLDVTVHARTLNSGALFAQIQGDYERALAWYHQSHAIWQRLGNLERQGLALLNLGILQYELHDYQEAETSVRASARLFESIGSEHRLALAHIELGLLCRDQGRWDESLDYSHRAAAYFERAGASDFLGRVINNVGEVELLRGHLEAAWEQFERASQLMTTRVYVVDVHINMGLVRQAAGDDAAALTHYQAALGLAHEIDRRDVLALIQYRIGHAQQRLGQPEAALANYAAAVAAIEARREPLRDEGLLISLMGRWQEVYEAAILLRLELGDVDGAFDYAERARARAFTDLLARRYTEASKDSRLNAAAEPIAAAEARAALPMGMLLLAYFATGLRGPESALLDAIPSQAAGLRACLAAQPRLLCFALTRDQLDVRVCPLDPNALQASSAYQADGQRFLRPAVLRRAYDALIAPVAARLAAASEVVVVPHGPLHQLPFAALLDPAGIPLLDHVAHLSCTPSATALLRARTANVPPDARPCLALGYGGGRDLRNTEPEATMVADVCAGDRWTGAGDLQGRLVREAGLYRWLHLACHGEFNLAEPLSSFLELGPDQRLNAADVLAQLALSAELVTLSACRTGLSLVMRGDEPMGLVRAFLSAGARAVLVTLWAVEDRSARLLMERFYQALIMGADPSAALRTAQQQLRALTTRDVRAQLGSWGEPAADLAGDDSTQPFADPFWWGAYTIVRTL